MVPTSASRGTLYAITLRPNQYIGNTFNQNIGNTSYGNLYVKSFLGGHEDAMEGDHALCQYS